MRPQHATIVGFGANGIVELVKNGDNVSVVKRLRDASDTDALDCFLAEIKLLEQLSHRSIVSTKPANSAPNALNGTPELFMEFLAGGDLRSALGRQMQCPGTRMYAFADALRWSTQVASALAYLHGRDPKVIFRDMSAANVLLTSTSSRGADAKLVDFGLAKLLPSQAECIRQGTGMLDDPQPKKSGGAVAMHVHASSQRALMTGETGAYTYMSPEMVQKSYYSEKVDIFSLGCLIYELFSRQLCASTLLAKSGGDERVLKRHALQVATGYRLPMPTTFPEPLRKLISACWAQNPAERPSAASVHAQLTLMQETGALQAMDGRRKSFSCFF